MRRRYRHTKEQRTWCLTKNSQLLAEKFVSFQDRGLILLLAFAFLPLPAALGNAVAPVRCVGFPLIFLGFV